MQEALRRMNIPKGALSLIESTDRETTNAFMKMKDYVDLLIPRGGRGLIQSVVNNATIPVIETGTETVMFMWISLLIRRWQSISLKMQRHSGSVYAMPANPLWCTGQLQKSFFQSCMQH